MADKKFFVGMLVIALVFGMVITGCDSDGGDTWSNVTSLSQVNGTWKGTITDTTVESGITIKMVGDVTITINANSGTMSGKIIATITFSGKDIDSIWPALKAEYISMGYTANNKNHSVTWTETSPTISITLADFRDAQINQNSTKLKLIGDDGEESILTKA
jgi:hypothetical protein